MTATSIRFLPGDVPAVASERLVALVGAHPQDPLVAAVADAVGRGEGVDAVLAVLQAHAWYQLPDFCLCERIEDGFRLAFRGPFEVRPDGEPVIDVRLDPWADGTVTNDAVTLRYAPSAPPAVGAGPYPGGVVRASVVRFATGAAAELMREQDAPRSAPSPVAGPSTGPSARSAATPADAVRPSAPAEPSAADVPPAPWEVSVPSGASPASPPPAYTPPPAYIPPVPSAYTPAAEASLDETMVVPADWAVREAAAPAVQTVLAGRCPAGHLTPAFAPECRVCRQPLAPQQPVEVPRPDLGALRLSTGEIVRLDRGAILGRRPVVPAGQTGEEVRAVVLHAPDGAVSAQHLEVVLDYWTVGVRDLGSTNGTEVTQPGRAPLRLRPHELVVLEPGAHVNLAGSVSFVFDPTA